MIMATFRGFASWLLQANQSNFFIHELLILMYTSLSLVVVYITKLICSKYFAAKPQDVHICTIPLRYFLIDNLRFGYILTLFIV